MDKCTICGSDRLLEGPAYDRMAYSCMDCGSQFNREVIKEPEQEQISVAILENALEFPEGGFKTPEEAMEHLAKLKAMHKGLSKTTEDRPQQPKRKKHPESDIDPGLVMAVMHYYQRNGESWSEVLSTGKGERAVRNFNILIWCHNHPVGRGCTSTCRELLSDG
jgi:hypothetical protein